MLASCLPPASKQKVLTKPLEQDLSNRLMSSNDGFRVDVDKETVRYAVTKAFESEPTMVWATEHVDFDTKQEKSDFMRFCNSIAFLEDLDAKNSFQMCEVDHDDEPNTTVVSVACVQEYDPQQKQKLVNGPPWIKSIRHNWHMISTVFRLLWIHGETMPIAMKNNSDEMKRMEGKVHEFVANVDYWHIKHGPSEKHWYIHMLGCNPDFQGQGKGKKILNKLCRMADERQQDMYLEAGGKLSSYYQKFGFTTTKTVEFVDPEDETIKIRDEHYSETPFSVSLNHLLNVSIKSK